MPPQQKRRAPKITPDSVTPDSETLPGDLRRDDQDTARPEELPEATDEELPAYGHSLAPDGGNHDHPMHDSEDDVTPGDAAREIERVEQTKRR